MAVRYQERYLTVAECAMAAAKPKETIVSKPAKPIRRKRGSDWNRNFILKKGPKVWQAAEASGYRRDEVVG
jgi:hypothetical protein